MSARSARVWGCLAIALIAGSVIEAAGQSSMLAPTVCDYVTSAARKSQMLGLYSNNAVGLPKSYADCLADYSLMMANASTEEQTESYYIKCLQGEINKYNSLSTTEAMLNPMYGSDFVERYSKHIASAATRLRELRENRYAFEKSAMVVRKKCEAAVDALNKYRDKTPDNDLKKYGTAPAPGQSFDGVYVGQVVYQGILRSNNAKEILKLTISGSRVTGSTSYADPKSMSIQTTITGTISADGMINATFTAVNHYRSGSVSAGGPGRMTGRTNGQTAFGSASFDRSSISQKPARGTWNVVRK